MKIAIIGAAYSGLQAAKYLKSKGHSITVTTTQDARVSELEPHADKVIVMKGSDADKMPELLKDQDVLLLTMAGGLVEREGKMVMDPELYRDAYVGTAQAVVEALPTAPQLKQIIFASSLTPYGDAHGVSPITEETPSNAQGPFQTVYIETEDILLGAQSDTLDIVIYRTGTIYGPGREFILSAKQMGAGPIPFDGESDVMLIHRDDVVGALAFAIDNKLVGRYNVFNDTKDSKREFFEKLCAKEDLPELTWLNLSPGPKNVSNDKLKEAGYQYLDPDSSRDSADLL